MAKRKKHIWTDGQIYTTCIAVSGAVEAVLIIAEGTIGLPPLGGSGVSQLGVVLGGGIAFAEIVRAGRMMIRSLSKPRAAKPFDRDHVRDQASTAAEIKA